ncbi:hypothetical protein [Corallococcus coralloides]|nr:hypothetical protein [Corallococcus coralloides]
MRSAELWNLVSAVLLSVGGAGALIFGLSSWLGKVWANRILEREKLAIQRELHTLQAESSLRLHELKERTDVLIKNIEAEHSRKHRVHNLQFAKEFELYTLIWKALHDLKLKIWALQPVGRPSEPLEKLKETRLRCVQEFAKAWRIVEQTVNENQPFFPKEVYEKIHALTQSSFDEAFKYSSGEWKDDFDLGLSQKALEGQQQLTSQIDAICNAIRTRIGLIEGVSAEP